MKFSCVFLNWMTSFRPVLQRRMRLSGFSLTDIEGRGAGRRTRLAWVNLPRSPDWIGLSHVGKGYACNRISVRVDTVKPGAPYYHTGTMYWAIHGSFLRPRESGYFWFSAHGNKGKAGGLYYTRGPMYEAVSQPRQDLQPHAYTT